MKVVASKNLPFRPPVIATIVMWLFLDRLDAPDIAWGIMGTLYAIVWIAWIAYAFQKEEVDIFSQMLPSELAEKLKAIRGKD